jgi:hypothetical protein
MLTSIFQLCIYNLMGFLLIGTSLIDKSRQATITGIKDCVIKKGIAQGS